MWNRPLFTSIKSTVVCLILLDSPLGILSNSTIKPAIAAPAVWQPALSMNWQWQLTTPVDLSVSADLWIIDLFDNDSSVVSALHANGRRAICSINAGAWENWRPDAGQFPIAVQGNGNGWPGERYLDIRRIDVLGPILLARIDLCVQKGFDGVEFDNVDGYTNSTGFPLTYYDQLTYNIFLANVAHARGLSVGLQNDVEQVHDLLPYFDWALNEQCFEYNECDALLPFIEAGKAVFNVEYSLFKSEFCPQANALNFNSMRKRLALGSWRSQCRSYDSPTPTGTPMASNTPTTSPTITATPVHTSTRTSTPTPTRTMTRTPTRTRTRTSTPTRTTTSSAAAPNTPTRTPTRTNTAGVALTPTPTRTHTPILPPAATLTTAPTATPPGPGTATTSPPRTATPSPTPVPPSITPTRTPTRTITPVPPTSTATRTPTASNTPTSTQTPQTAATNTPSPIWRPTLRTTWQWQLTGALDLSVLAEMWDIDLFDNRASAVTAIHALGSRAVCYMSAGSWEDWRPDAGQFPASVKGNSNGWPGERWLDIRQLGILGPIMEARLDLCRSKGFDGVEFDNVDGYSNNTGFPLTYQDQITYNRFLANAAHARGLAAALKNDLDQVPDLLPYFDFAINEECFAFDECSALVPFVSAGKAVFHVEYDLSTGSFCPQANAMNFNSMRKRLDLDAWREPCW